MYELVLHDYGNCALQILTYSDDKKELQKIADNINYLNITNIEAMVYPPESETK